MLIKNTIKTSLIVVLIAGVVLFAVCNKYAESLDLALESEKGGLHLEEHVCIDNTSGKLQYHDLIYSKALKYQVEPALVYAMIMVESSGRSRAISRKGAKGLMQLMPATARQMNVKNPFNPEENIEGGVKYMSYLLDRFNGDVAFALAAYNAGPRKIERFRGIPPFKETQRYVKKVLSIYIQESPVSNELYM